MRKHYLLTAVVLLALLLGLVGGTSAPVAANNGVKVQLAMVLDGSGSIGPTNWGIIKEGLASSIEDPKCVPHDGSVELTVVQFGYYGPTYAKVEVWPTVIDSDAAAAIAAAARAMPYGNGFTPMAHGIKLAADTLASSSNFNTDIKQAINLVTDGNPNRCHPDFPEGWSSGYCWDAKANTVAARNYAISTLFMTTSQDEFDAEAIGTAPDVSWLRDNVVWPQPGYDSWPPPGPGWVRVVEDATEFAETICEKFKVIIEPGTITAHKFNDLNGNGTQDGDEPDLSNWTMTLYSGSGCSGTVLASGNTTGSGNVSFSDLTPGDYSVAETLKDCWQVTTPAGNPSICHNVTLSPGGSETLNFGNRKIPYTLTVVADPSGGGTVTGSGSYNCCTNAPISASPNECYEFTGWTTDNTDEITDPSAANTTVHIDKDKTVTAHFAKYKYTLTVTSEGCCPITVGDLGPVAAGGNQTFNDIPCCTNVTLDAITPDCCTFDGWELDGSSVPGDPIEIHMGQNHTAIVHCSPTMWDLTVISDGCCTISGDVTVASNSTETAKFPCCTTVSLNATAPDCCEFVNWTGDVPDGSTTDNPIEIHMDSDKTVIAHCTPKMWTLTVTSDGCCDIDVNGDGEADVAADETEKFTYPCCTSVTLEAVTPECCVFDGWKVDDVSQDGVNPITVHMGSNHTAIASCHMQPGTITIVKDSDPDDGTDFPFTGDLGGFTLDDAVPDDGDPVSSSQTFTDLLPGTYNVTEIVPAGWDLTNISCSGNATVQIGHDTTFDSDFDEGDDTVRITLGAGQSANCTFTNQERVTPQAMIGITKSVNPTSAAPEDTVEYTIEYENPGDVTLHNVIIEDDYDQAYIDSVFDISDSGTDDGSKITWNIGELSTSTSGSVTYKATLKGPSTFSPGNTNIDNIATIDSDETDPLTDDATVTVTKAEPQAPTIDLTKTADKSQAYVGDTITYTFEVENTGTVDIVSLIRTDVTGICDAPMVRGNDNPGDNDNTLEPGEVWVYTCSHEVTAGDDNPLVNTAIFRGYDAQGVWDQERDTATVDILEGLVPVGGTVAPVDKIAILARWLGLPAVLVAGIRWFTLRRYEA